MLQRSILEGRWSLLSLRIRLEDLSKEELIEIIKEKIKEIEKLKKEKENLEKDLNKYKNSNTPSSANKHLQPNTQGKQIKNGAKRGAPKGHRGTTRYQVPTRKEVIDATRCPNCNSTNLKDKKIIKQVVEEIPEPVIPETIETEIHIKECLDCNFEFIPPNNTTPLKGKFGINLMVLIVFIKFILRGVLRKTGCFLKIGFAFSITPASINTIVKRVADAAESEYEKLKAEIRKSTLVYVDETSFSVLGKKWWVWVFRTENSSVLVIRPSRGSNVLREVLGEDYSGIVICDCWRAYNFLINALLQRCWAHLLRKSKEFCKTVPGNHLHNKLEALFKEIKEFNEKDPTDKQRQRKYKQMTIELEKIVIYYSRYSHLNGIVGYINNNLENWFTCIKVEGVEPTNNFAERAIRETVMIRKIIGAFRSLKGPQNYEILASLLATWQIQELDIKTQLKQMLTKNLCFS